NVKIKEDYYIRMIQDRLSRFKLLDRNDSSPALTEQQLQELQQIKRDTNWAMPPLQRLEHSMHSLVTFGILPIFALANAGVSLDLDMDELFSTNVALGVALGLLVGKVVGVVGFTLLCAKLKISTLPAGMT